MNEKDYIDLDKLNVSLAKGNVADLPNEDVQKKPKKKVVKKKKVKTTKGSVVVSKNTQKNKSSKKLIYLLIGFLLIALLVIAIVTFFRPKNEITEDKVLVLVNGEPVYSDEVKTRTDWLRLMNGMPITDIEALELSVDLELLVQEAKRRNMSVAEEELQTLFSDMAISVGITYAELQKYIEGYGINYGTLRTIIKKELLASKLIEEVVYSKEITEEELRKYYEENKMFFVHQNQSSFEDVRDILKQQLSVLGAEERYRALLAQLRANAVIEDYTGKIKTAEKESTVIEINLSDVLSEVDLNGSVIDVVDEPVVEVVVDEPVVDEPVVDEVVVDEPVVESPALEETTQPTRNTLRLAKCLTEKGAKMYSTYWSPDDKKQAQIFGESFEYIIRIECDAAGINPKVAECKNVLKKEFPTWPTWQINGNLYEGYQNLNNLITISGC